MKKKVTRCGPKFTNNYKALKICWLLNWVSIARVVTCFLQASLSRPVATRNLSRKHRVFVLARPTRAMCSPVQPAHAEQESSSKSLASWQLILPSKPSMVFWNRQAGAQTFTQTWTLTPDQRVVKVLSPPKSQHKLWGVWSLFKSFTDAKFEPSEVKFLMLMPSTGKDCWLALCAHLWIVGSWWRNNPIESVLANLVLWQVLKTIWHWAKIDKRFKLCFGIVIYTKDTDTSTPSIFRILLLLPTLSEIYSALIALFSCITSNIKLVTF